MANKPVKKAPPAQQSFSYTNTIELAKKVANKWQEKYPNYACAYCSSNDLQQQAQSLEEIVEQNKQQTRDKALNTLELAEINELIDDAAKTMKGFIDGTYYGRDTKPIYTACGLVKVGKKKSRYQLPYENDERQSAMNAILHQITTQDGVLQQMNGGETLWEGLQDKHRLAWDESCSMRSDKATFVRQTKAALKTIKNSLSKLKRSIRIDFEGDDVNGILREFGFLKDIG